MFSMFSIQRTLKPIGEEALLTCAVAANPSNDLKFEWRHEGQLLVGETTKEIKVRGDGDVDETSRGKG